MLLIRTVSALLFLTVAPCSSSDLLDRWNDFLSQELSAARMESFQSYIVNKDEDFAMFDTVNGLYVSEQDAAHFPDVEPCDFECVFETFDGFRHQEEHLRRTWESGTSPEEKDRIVEFFGNIYGERDLILASSSSSSNFFGPFL